jgi:septal ring factor EnvC (AmiA/AmiB activator)
MVFQSRSIRQMLGDLDHATDRMMPMAGNTPELERIEGPRRKALQLLVTRGLHEIEALKIDLADSDLLSQKISDEQAQLNYLVHDLEEQRAMLELNRQLQVDVLQKKFDERLAQLENYRKLKSAEQQVEGMIQDFNARKELQKNMENDRLSEKMAQSQFAKLKGKLGLPVEGRILSQFGRNLDLKTKLTIFKKGLEIESGKNVPVKAISNGKVAFSGELPNYGRVTIVDHGDHFYSLVANLGELKRQVGDVIQSGDVLGQTDTQGTPVYFEIRARNIPVNPLQWVHN